MDLNTTEKQGTELREDFRMDVEVPFAFNLIDDDSIKDEPENIDRCLKAIEAEVPGGANLASAFRVLNDKLSTIIALLDNAGKNDSVPDRREISISVGGVRFRNEKPLLPGEKVRLLIGFPPLPYTMINTHGAVIRSVEKTDESGSYYLIAVKFQQLDEEERQDITRFLFNAQRRSAR